MSIQWKMRDEVSDGKTFHAYKPVHQELFILYIVAFFTFFFGDIFFGIPETYFNWLFLLAFVVIGSNFIELREVFFAPMRGKEIRYVANPDAKGFWGSFKKYEIWIQE